MRFWVAFSALALTACPEGGSSPKTSFDPNEAFSQAHDAFGSVAPPNKPAVKRKGSFAGFNEQFNRYYTEPGWTPSKTIYVSPNGSGSGSSPSSPASANAGMIDARPGTRVFFQKGNYNGCFGWENFEGGTYDAPVVLYAERNSDGSRGVKIQCCGSGRASCFNFERTSYIAVDGFELKGGRYGVRSVGMDYAASKHAWGIAVLNTKTDGQGYDGLFTGASDWAVFENNVVINSGEGDGHGIYLSNGSDWNIVRNNDLYGNEGGTFQINADPLSCCEGGTNNEDCDAIAGSGGEGGRGASDFFLVENNYFHHGDAQGSNFTSVRYSTVRNNVFAVWGRHGTSFWSETADPKDKQLYNPKLGAHHNRVYHNLFVTTNDKQALQFINNSDFNEVKNNLIVGMTINGTGIRPRPSAVWMETDGSVTHNVYENNVYLSGKFDGRSGPTATELAKQELNPAWFAKLPTGLPSVVSDFAPRAGAPYLDRAPRLPSVTLDRDGKPRGNPADVGPFELP